MKEIQKKMKKTTKISNRKRGRFILATSTNRAYTVCRKMSKNEVTKDFFINGGKENELKNSAKAIH